MTTQKGLMQIRALLVLPGSPTKRSLSMIASIGSSSSLLPLKINSSIKVMPMPRSPKNSTRLGEAWKLMLLLRNVMDSCLHKTRFLRHRPTRLLLENKSRWKH